MSEPKHVDALSQGHSAWYSWRRANPTTTPDLADENLSGRTLRDLDLSRAVLRYTDLSAADLRSTDLSYADLRGANLCNADLRHASLVRARLEGADLSGAKLYGAASQDWIISGATCTHLFADESATVRRPEYRDFAAGEFAERFARCGLESALSEAKPWKIPLVNFALFVALGAAAVLWMFLFTGGLSDAGELFGLSVILAWMGVIFGFVSEVHKTRWREIFDHGMEDWRLGCALVGVALLLGVWEAPRWGGILVSGMGEDTARRVEVYAPGEKDPIKTVLLRPGDSIVVPVKTPWASSAEYVVRVENRPDLLVSVPALDRKELDSPRDFNRRPTFLFTPSGEQADIALHGNVFLEVQIGSDVEMLPDYRGELVWIGTRTDVEIPEFLLQQWHAELRADNTPEANVTQWTVPRSLFSPEPPKPFQEFQVGASITVRLCSNETHKSISAWSGSVKALAQFPQRIALPESASTVKCSN